MDIRAERIKNGLCMYCGVEPARKGVKTCVVCYNKFKATRESLKSRGICPRCQKNPIKKGRGTCEVCLKRQLDIRNRDAKKERYDSLYGLTNGQLRCTNCGLPFYEVLQVHHLGNNGKKHREKIHKGTSIHRFIIKQNFPTDYLVLCSNCHDFWHKEGQLPTKEELTKLYRVALKFCEVSQ